MKSYTVMGLDFSLTSPGFGALTIYEDLTIEYKDCGGVKTKPSETWYTRISRIEKETALFVQQNNPGFIYVENYSFGSTNGRETAGEVHGSILFSLMNRGYKEDRIRRVIAPQALKKFVTGSSKAMKKDMVAWANERFGLTLKPTEDDRADALALAYTGIHLLHYEDLKDRMTPEQIEVAEKILFPKPKKKKTKKEKTGGK